MEMDGTSTRRPRSEPDSRHKVREAVKCEGVVPTMTISACTSLLLDAHALARARAHGCGCGCNSWVVSEHVGRKC